MHYLENVKRHLDMPTAEKEQVMREISSHYFEIRDELLASGMSQAQAWDEAARRLGEPTDVAARLSAVHNSASWKSALLAAVPFSWIMIPCFVRGAGKFNVKLYVLSIALYAAFMIGGSVRELMRGRRPIWLATWLFGALCSALALIHMPAILINPANSFSPIRVCTTGIIITAAIAVACKYPRWRTAATLFVAAQVTALVFLYRATGGHTASALLALLTITQCLLYISLNIVLALEVFAKHDNGSAAAGSLFVFTSLALYAGGMFVLSGLPSIAVFLIPALTAIIFARTPSLIAKLILAPTGLALFSTVIFMLNVLRSSKQSNVFASVDMSACVRVFAVVFVVCGVIVALVPAIAAKSKRDNRLEIAD